MHSPPRSRMSTLGMISFGLVVAFSVGACGGATANGPDPFSAAPQDGEERGSPDLIVGSEIRSVENTHPSAFLMIRRLRPRWLRTGAGISFGDPNAGEPVVYVDGLRYGSIQTLQQLSSTNVQRLEYIGPADATTRWGTGHMGGVILVDTGR